MLLEAIPRNLSASNISRYTVHNIYDKKKAWERD